MIDKEQVIKALKCYRMKDPESRENCQNMDCPYNNNDPNYGYWCCSNRLLLDAIRLLGEQGEAIDKLYDILDDVCKKVREITVESYVCGLCQYDGAYRTDSGDWMNECPGFENDDCFCMKNKIRELCGKPLLDEP